MIKAEIFQDVALLLDQQGRVWQVHVHYDGQPIMQEVIRISPERVMSIMEPSLAKYATRIH